ncbi:Peptidase family M23 [Lutibacter oricola]|uniref:Peptidase family M23 n=1 Tax=Lutibacter oricola TaxID=762486 RepID=A0A1H2XU81_9FLAO|nr:M23 family metallopeptidase [Lutibacter oricola]SDW96512.1 Peptidase family M23 [Lutibacter oricola]
MRKIAFIILLFTTFMVFPQGNTSKSNTYPQNYFRSPLDIPLVLSGTFGELRPNHFHAGLDLKTQQREGLNIYASAPGYVSRIKISLWGYGKAIYITHPNGYTSVYAHIKKFSDRIEKYIKKQQYKKESFEIQLFPAATTLPISANELIAYSGSTGGFVGPHLHFEIRNSRTEKPINPMYFGITVKDSKKPKINTLIGYPSSKNSHINKIGYKNQIALVQAKNGDLVARKITAFGKIGFGINSYDQLDGAYNKNGLYSLELFVNGQKKHEFRAESFAFSEGKYINLLIDYERYANLNQRIQKCFIEPANNLSMYKSKSSSKGYITIKDSLTYNVEIVAKDFKGNSQKIRIPILGKKEAKVISKKEKITPYKINYNEFKRVSKNGISAAFPKGTFYNNFYLDFSVKDTIATVHTPTLPLKRSYTLTFDVSKYSEQDKKQLYIAHYNNKGLTSYKKTVKQPKFFYTTTKDLGKFTLLKDTKKPIIKLYNFKNEQWLTNAKTLKLKISDLHSGINTYRGEIDGKWILMEYNVKSGTLTYDLSDKSFTTAKHNLKVTVTDNVGNKSTLNATFFRKK